MTASRSRGATGPCIHFYWWRYANLFEGRWISALLEGIAARAALSSGIEITLESNPGSAESAHFAAYHAAGVNRLSIGVQSFHDDALQALGRIHSGDEARRALDLASDAGFTRWNIDLMHGLPGQDSESAQADLIEALGRSAGHVSWYQLTIERNTRFWSSPPALPDDSALAAIQEAGEEPSQRLTTSYECRPSPKGEESQHNLNYWRFGDYIGLGAGLSAARRHHYSDAANPRLRLSYSRHRRRCHKHRPPTEPNHWFAMNTLRLKSALRFWANNRCRGRRWSPRPVLISGLVGATVSGAVCNNALAIVSGQCDRDLSLTSHPENEYQALAKHLRPGSRYGE